MSISPTIDEQELPEQLEGEDPEVEDYGGDGMPELPEDKQVILKDLLKKALQREIYSRRTEVIDARLQRFYSRTIQYIFWNWSTGMFAPLLQGGSANQGSDQDRYCEVYDIFSAFLRTLVAALSQNPLEAHMVPRTPKRTVDISAAEAAEYYRSRLEQVNDIKQLQVDVARLFCTDGRVVSLVVDMPPDAKYGMDADGNPVGAEIIEVDGILEWKVPITQEFCNWPYAIRSKELELEYAQEKYPNAVDEAGESKIITGSASAGESAYERMARLGVLQGTKLLTATGETWEHLVTEHIAFFRPSFFRAAAKENRDWLKETFPNGMKLVVTGDAYCSAHDLKMEDYVTVAHSKPGDGQNRTSLMKAMVPIQDAFNDLWNLQKEIFEYCIPEKWLDKETYDLVAQQEHRSEPGNSNPVVLMPGGVDDIRKHIYVEGNIEVPASMIEAMNQLSGELAQLITAALPSLMGSADTHNETKGGIAMMREQALGQMGIAWGASQNLLGKAEEQAIKLAGRTQPNETKLQISVAGDDTSPDSIKSIEIGQLNAGDFCYEVDDSFPDTRAMRRAIFNSLLQMSAHSPALQAILELPENQALFKEMVDPDLEIPGADARLQQKREIDKLLSTKPIPPSPQQLAQVIQTMAQASAAGQAPPTPPPLAQIVQKLSQPSVPIDPEWDYHQFHLEVIQNWLAGNECYEQQQKGNQVGIENVKMHGALHKQALQAQQGPPQGKPPSESINFADLPDAGKVQMAAHGGITLTPQDIAQQKVEKQAEAALKPQGAANA